MDSSLKRGSIVLAIYPFTDLSSAKRRPALVVSASERPGRDLEVGCGTGFFTLTAAQMLGEQGSLIAMDMLPISVSVEAVTKKVQAAGLSNVQVIKGDALETKLSVCGGLLTAFSGTAGQEIGKESACYG